MTSEEHAKVLAAALQAILDRGRTDDDGDFILYTTQEELDDENNGIKEVSEAINALHDYYADNPQ